MKEKVIAIMSSVFNYEKTLINNDSSMDSIDKWDSLHHMNLIAALEEEFKLTFSDDEIPEMISLENILKVLEIKTR